MTQDFLTLENNMYLNVTDNLNEIKDNLYYANIIDDEISGVSLGSYIKAHKEYFVGKELMYVPDEQAENIMWSL